jgi:hypothetical protein
MRKFPGGTAQSSPISSPAPFFRLRHGHDPCHPSPPFLPSGRFHYHAPPDSMAKVMAIGLIVAYGYLMEFYAW